MAPKEEYSRADVRRKFGVTERLLKSWEKQELIPAADTYAFSDLIAIQTLIKLRENRIHPRQIGDALASLRRKLTWVKHPLSELRVVSNGKKITVHVAGQKMEAVSGQILFDFEAAGLSGVRAFPERRKTVTRMRESEAWFQKGLELEETGAPVDEAIDAYRKVLELNPGAAGALVNLGTIFYRQRKFADAERYYREAIEVDATYPLAQFNLGNLYDEQGRIKEAFDHYRTALTLNPNYADAHFNLALLCERTGDALKAVHHWKAYLKLDNSGQWAEIARRQLERLRQAVIR
ncbi:MAG TPA: tetratricopeptide repeat protein [Candidatus Sulfopaludibacter sp.]|nr:tetratricopeptide repeat protein [Candidatus Sulfopaludibacter sp.]